MQATSLFSLMEKTRHPQCRQVCAAHLYPSRGPPLRVRAQSCLRFRHLLSSCAGILFSIAHTGKIAHAPSVMASVACAGVPCIAAAELRNIWRGPNKSECRHPETGEKELYAYVERIDEEGKRQTLTVAVATKRGTKSQGSASGTKPKDSKAWNWAPHAAVGTGHFKRGWNEVVSWVETHFIDQGDKPAAHEGMRTRRAAAVSAHIDNEPLTAWALDELREGGAEVAELRATHKVLHAAARAPGSVPPEELQAALQKIQAMVVRRGLC